MNIAAMLMFLIWCGLVVSIIMSWAIKSTFVQLRDTLERDIEKIELDELDRDNIN